MWDSPSSTPAAVFPVLLLRQLHRSLCLARGCFGVVDGDLDGLAHRHAHVEFLAGLCTDGGAHVLGTFLVSSAFSSS